jgi:hypothetical protein
MEENVGDAKEGKEENAGDPKDGAEENARNTKKNAGDAKEPREERTPFVLFAFFRLVRGPNTLPILP